MQFSLWNFADWFTKEKIDCEPVISSTRADIQFLTMANMQKIDKLQACSANICDGKFLGYPNYQTVLFKGKDKILFPNASPLEILNLGNQMIEVISEWEHDLYDFILNKEPINHLLNRTESVLRLPFAIISPSCEVLYASKGWQINLSKYHFDFPSKQKEPIIHTSNSKEKRAFLIQSLINEKNYYFGELIAYEDNKKFSPGYIHLFQALSKAILNYLESNKQFFELGLSLETFLMDALNRHYVDLNKLNKFISVEGWPKNGYFSIYCIQPINKRANKKRKFLHSILKNLIHASSCFIYKGAVIFVSYSKLDRIKSITEKLSHTVPSDSFVIGQSLIFDDPYNLSNYYKQSVYAADYAKRNKLRFVSMEDILPEVIFNSFEDNEWLQSLVHPDILKLMDEDRNQNEDLLKTLYYYLILGQNGSEAADALYIHRNTLRSRINKIKSILTVDLNCSETIEQLLASYLIIGKNFIKHDR